MCLKKIIKKEGGGVRNVEVGKIHCVHEADCKIFVFTEFYTHWCFLVNRFDKKLLVIERDVSNLTPGEADLWCQSEENTIKLLYTSNY